ncbi:MAG: GxxExxY protein [Planctomycetes bacterium]|nr:GxxExxY protein [Planctomycetota bacterium]
MKGVGSRDAETEGIMALCDVVRQTGFDLHKYLKHGHLEKIYENGLAHRLAKKGVKFVAQHPLKVCDEDGTVLGDYVADLFVEDQLLVEIKACRALVSEHEAQLLGYLRACQIRHGLLINFGAPRYEIRKFIL